MDCTQYDHDISESTINGRVARVATSKADALHLLTDHGEPTPLFWLGDQVKSEDVAP